MTHTAGFSYEVWDATRERYVKASGMPSTATGKVAALRMPLVFDPGDKWEYGVNIDWVGRIVESVSGQPIDAYFQDRIFAPLDMKDSGFVSSPEQRARQASVHQRQADGSLVPQPLETPFVPEFYAGGGGLYSTANDYLSFLQMLLNGGSFNGARILQAGDGRADGAQPHRRHPGGHPEVATCRRARTTSISSPARRSAGRSATCSTCRRGPTAAAPAR